MNALAQSRVAAFFDLDGTLISKPSLETRLVTWLLRHRAIPTRNFFNWLAEAVRLAPYGLSAMRHANKMVLRRIFHEKLLRQSGDAMSTPSFLPDAIRRLTWHAHRGHSIFLITGALAPLAREIAQTITALLALRGIPAYLGVRATNLEEHNGYWTGCVDGAPMFGPMKATTVRLLASEMSLNLARSYAYADSFTDRHMLEAVGLPSAVNPSLRLHRLARRRHWPILRWLPQAKSAQPLTEFCSSGLLFRPAAVGQQEHKSSLGKFA